MLQILLVSSLLISSLAQAQEEKLFKLLTPSQIKSLLGPYPAKGSLDEFNDFASLIKHQLSRTEQDCVEAAADEKISGPWRQDVRAPFTLLGEHRVSPVNEP